MNERRVAYVNFQVGIRVLEAESDPDEFVFLIGLMMLNDWGVRDATRREAGLPPDSWYMVERPEDIKIRWEITDCPQMQFRDYRAWSDFLERSRTFTPSATIHAEAAMVVFKRFRPRRSAWDSRRDRIFEGHLSLAITLWSRVSQAGRALARAWRVPPDQLNPDPIYPNLFIDTARGHDRAYFGDARYHDIAYSSSLCTRPSVRSQFFGRALFFERGLPCPWSVGALHRWVVEPYKRRTEGQGSGRFKIVRWRSRRRPWETWCEVLSVPLDYAATTGRMAGRALFGVEHPAEFGDFADLCDEYKNRPENLARNRRLLLQLGAGKFAHISNERPGVLS